MQMLGLKKEQKKNRQRKKKNYSSCDQITLVTNDMKQGFSHVVFASHDFETSHIVQEYYYDHKVPARATGHVTSIPVSSSEECIMLIKLPPLSKAENTVLHSSKISL